jgi:3-oxoacyl-[acyl-carrier protein] reductase
MKNYGKLLEGKHAAVSCGGNPCGAEVVRKFAIHGAAVAFGVMDRETGDRILEEISPMSPQSFYMIVDLADSERVEAFCRETKKRFPMTDILVNNPYADRPVSITESCEEDDSYFLQVNQRSIMQTLRAFFGPMKENKGGSIINISSNTAFKAIPGNPFLTMSMAAVGGMTRVAAFEGAEFHVRVNEILSGILPGRDSLPACPLRTEGPDTGGIADVALFLASDMSSYITGESITVDGGARRALPS